MHVQNEEPQEGWYTDPFGRHEARWISNGRPTKLVRDAGVDSFDEPPDEAPVREAVRVEHPDAQRPGDLRRADAAEARGPSDDVDTSDGVFDGFAESQLD